MFFSIVNYLVRTFSNSPELIELSNFVFYAFYVGAEVNIPTFYASFSLMACAALLAIIAYVHHIRQDGFVNYWVGLSLGFAAMSFDEYVSIHENAGVYLGQYINLPGKSWLVLGVVVVGLVAVLYWRFVGVLPPQTRTLLFLSAAVYLTGAMGFEVVETYYTGAYGLANAGYELLTYLEETLEMIGVALLFYTLVFYLEHYLGRGTITMSVVKE
jgi:hypothetical protein